MRSLIGTKLAIKLAKESDKKSLHLMEHILTLPKVKMNQSLVLNLHQMVGLPMSLLFNGFALFTKLQFLEFNKGGQGFF